MLNCLSMAESSSPNLFLHHDFTANTLSVREYGDCQKESGRADQGIKRGGANPATTPSTSPGNVYTTEISQSREAQPIITYTQIGSVMPGAISVDMFRCETN